MKVLNRRTVVTRKLYSGYLYQGKHHSPTVETLHNDISVIKNQVKQKQQNSWILETTIRLN